MAHDLWVDLFKPKTLDEYVWRDPQLRKKAEEWIATGSLPHLLLYGGPGGGKTSLADLLIRLLDIPSGDYMRIPASKERKIDDLEDKITGFGANWALGPTGIKYVLLDEADALTILAQKTLRGEIENPGSLVRFIFTCNYPEKLMTPIRSRCQEFRLDGMDRDEFTVRAGEVLTKMDVTFDIDVLLAIVSQTYPDLRKCINVLQQSTIAGVLNLPTKEEISVKDYVIEMANLFKEGRILEGRKLVAEKAPVEEYPDIYRYLYRNLDLWADTQEKQDEALIIIRRGLVYHATIADPEINLSATIAELTRL